MAGATIGRRERTEFAKDPERFRLEFGAGLGLPALVVDDFRACPKKWMARSHWVNSTTCRCTFVPVTDEDLRRATFEDAISRARGGASAPLASEGGL